MRKFPEIKTKEGHKPEYAYHCEKCKFNWCCGFSCHCVVEFKENLPFPPKARQEEVNESLIKDGFAPEFLPNGKRAREKKRENPTK